MTPAEYMMIGGLIAIVVIFALRQAYKVFFAYPMRAKKLLTGGQ